MWPAGDAVTCDNDIRQATSRTATVERSTDSDERGTGQRLPTRDRWTCGPISHRFLSELHFVNDLRVACIADCASCTSHPVSDGATVSLPEIASSTLSPVKGGRGFNAAGLAGAKPKRSRPGCSKRLGPNPNVIVS